MEIPNALVVFFLCVIVVSVMFIITILRTRQIMLIHKAYFAAAISLIIWLIALICIKFTDPLNINMLSFWDATTTMAAAFIPACSLLFSICYTKEYESNLPKRYWLMFIIPVITTIMVYTNKYHHLYYKVFSLVNTTVKFGPYFVVHSIYTFSCVTLAVFLIIRFAFKTKTRLHIWQAFLFTIGSLAPSIVNVLVLSNKIEANIILTPISFIITLIFHGIVIYRLHLLDIKPMAMQQLINWLVDGYVVTNETGIIVSYNRPFMELLGNQYHIRENMSLHDCAQNEDLENKTAMYNLLTAMRSCQESHTRVTYEQAFSLQKGDEMVRYFYLAEVTPLITEGKLCGFLSIFRDITQYKTNMQRLQDNQVKMAEQERLAFLGQMVGGLAHNLKTPIMSISGSVSAVENLIEECQTSIGDPEVTAEDYHEIYGEVTTWLQRMREACTYMSDIISAVKGQAGNMNVSDSVDFPLDEAFKRVSLLLRHELLNNHCTLKINNSFPDQEILIHGDINNLVQIINNLVVNAIDAQTLGGNHDIEVNVVIDETALQIQIKDYGSGIPDHVRKKLFQEMVTSKGTKGSGLGIFISNTVIRAKFDGSMWFDDNPEGGTVWGIRIPVNNITVINRKKVLASEEE